MAMPRRGSCRRFSISGAAAMLPANSWERRQSRRRSEPHREEGFMSVPDSSLPSDANASGRSLGREELELLERVIESGTLNCTKGTMVSRFEKRFAELVGASFCRCTTSGTAAIHAAVAALNPDPGDEIVTTSITDMGAITPILYQTAIPVFADVDPHTYNVTPDTIRRKLTRRTRAVIVTHLFGNACEMHPIAL